MRMLEDFNYQKITSGDETMLHKCSYRHISFTVIFTQQTSFIM